MPESTIDPLTLALASEPLPSITTPPGAYLREWMEDSDADHAEVAFRLNLTAEELDQLLAGLRPVSTALAQDLGALTDLAAKTWLHYDRLFAADLARLAEVRLARLGQLHDRTRFVGGKSACLLRVGDEVALRDLSGDPEHRGSARIATLTPHEGRKILITTVDEEIYLVPNAQLVLFSRDV